MTRRNIIFVDENPDVLEELRATFEEMREAWAMAFAQSGEEALSMLDSVSFDVVIADLGVTGAGEGQLLNDVKDKHPHVVRIVLAEMSDKDEAMKNADPVHQYLTKPYSSEKLKSILNRACGLRDRLTDEKLMAVVSKMDSLPSMPTVYVQLMEELAAQEPSMRNLGEIISMDMGLTAKILKLVNSALFGLRAEVTSPAQAVSILGLEMIKGLVLSVQVFSQFDSGKTGLFSMEEVWNHSMASGVISRDIAKAEKGEKAVVGDAFMAGMLHDSGKLVLATSYPKEYGKIYAQAREQQIPICDAELQVIGTSHEDVGAYLMGLWGLPDSIVEAIAYHHRPGECSCRTVCPLTYVHVGDALEREGKDDGDSALDERYLETLGLTDRVTHWRALCEEKAAKG